MPLVVITALWKRLPLARVMVQRLHAQGVLVVAAGSEGNASREVAEAAGAAYVEVPNTPYGTKWNRVLQASRAFNPSAVMVLGSDDFVSDGLIARWRDRIADHPYLGLHDIYFYQPVPTHQLLHWRGYTNERRGEAIGSARCIRADVLKKVDWKIWPDDLAYGLDGAMTARLQPLKVPAHVSTMEPGIEHVDVKVPGLGMTPINLLVKDSVACPLTALDAFGPRFQVEIDEAVRASLIAA